METILRSNSLGEYIRQIIESMLRNYGEQSIAVASSDRDPAEIVAQINTLAVEQERVHRWLNVQTDEWWANNEQRQATWEQLAPTAIYSVQLPTGHLAQWVAQTLAVAALDYAKRRNDMLQGVWLGHEQEVVLDWVVAQSHAWWFERWQRSEGWETIKPLAYKATNIIPIPPQMPAWMIYRDQIIMQARQEYTQSIQEQQEDDSAGLCEFESNLHADEIDGLYDQQLDIEAFLAEQVEAWWQPYMQVQRTWAEIAEEIRGYVWLRNITGFSPDQPS